MSTLRVCPTMAATPDLLIAVAPAAASARMIAELPKTLIDLLVIEFPRMRSWPNWFQLVPSSGPPDTFERDDGRMRRTRGLRIVDLEETDLLVHALGLLLQRLGGGRVLLHQRR